MVLNLAAAFAVGLLIFVVAYVVLTTYNAIVALIQRADRAWANVDVLLRQRHDELPNLVNAVRDLMAYERGVLEEVTRLRSAYEPGRPSREQAATSDATSAAIRQLFAVVERYPQIRSQENVLSLQKEIARLEDMIADRRELYNDTVYRYNTRIDQVPAVFLAGLFGWRPRPMFTASPEDLVRPEASITPA